MCLIEAAADEAERKERVLCMCSGHSPGGAVAVLLDADVALVVSRWVVGASPHCVPVWDDEIMFQSVDIVCDADGQF